MTADPKLAVFLPEASERDSFFSLLQRHSYTLDTVRTTEELQRLDRPDAILLPPGLSSGKSSMATCLEIRSDENFGSVPIIAVSASAERPVIQTLFEVGADIVIPAPVDADYLFYQVHALKRMAINICGQQKLESPHGGSQNWFSALDLMTEGIVIFDSESHPIFLNQVAQTLLAVTQETPDDQILSLFGPIVAEDYATPGKTARPQKDSGIRYEFLRRITGQSFRARARTCPLYSDSGIQTGFAVVFSDATSFSQLHDMLLHSLQVRSLCLLTSGLAMRSLDPLPNGTLTPPVQRLLDKASSLERGAAVQTILTLLMEFLDAIVSPNIIIRADVRGTPNVVLNEVDLFQLLGHLILHAVEFAGQGGETLIQIGENVPGEGVPVVVIARSKRVTPMIVQDPLSDLLSDSIEDLTSPSTPNTKIRAGLHAAQEIARRYRTTLEFRAPSVSEMKIRVKLPPYLKK